MSYLYISDDYYIRIKGKFKKFISEKDQKSHISVVSHFIETDLKGTLKFKCDELIHPDKVKCKWNDVIFFKNLI